MVGYQHKLCLFADDVLLFLTVPHTSRPNFFQIQDHFTSVSELEMNQLHSQAVNIMLAPCTLNQVQYACKL